MSADTTFAMRPDRLAELEQEAQAWLEARIEPQPSGSHWLGLDTNQMVTDFFWWMIQRNSIGHDLWFAAWLESRLAGMDGVKKPLLSQEFHGYQCWTVQPKGSWVPSPRLLPKEARKELTMEPGPWVRMPFQSYGVALDYLLYKFGSVTSEGRFIGALGLECPTGGGTPGSGDSVFEWQPASTETPYGSGTLRVSVADIAISVADERVCN